MVYLRVAEEDMRYHMWEVVRLFYDENEVGVVETVPSDLHQGMIISGEWVEEKETSAFLLQIVRGGWQWKEYFPISSEERKSDAARKRFKWRWKRALFIELERICHKRLPWGMLTGIRPAKIVHEMLEQGKSKLEIMKQLAEYYFVSESKSELIYEVAQNEKKILDASDRDEIGIYIGIPFCPTRCLYCSFTSNPIGKCGHWVGNYLGALKQEIAGTREVINEKRYRIESIYIGGGTPTSIEAQQLEELLRFIEKSFDLSNIKEYTLEAGRPDSITREKLKAIKNSRVDRISINPQTMNNETLRTIGRNHSSEDIVHAFQMARELGFDNINMDIIVGLPGETKEMFRHTLSEIERLGPENLTVHTMAVKRASKLKENKEQYKLITSEEAAAMVEEAQNFAYAMRMHPYYLYRQKNMLGGLENVGYCKPGFESVYNVQIMEERQTVIALGAGAITKVVYPDENRIERAFNVKNVEEYINRIDEMLERKKKLLYESY